MIFSNRGGTSYADFNAYLSNLMADPSCRIAKGILRPDQVSARPHPQMAGLQLVDAVASSFYYACEPNRFGFNEPRYVQMLRPILYERGGRAFSYGLKMFPNQAVKLIGADARMRWAVELGA